MTTLTQSKKPSAIEAMQSALNRILAQQMRCVDDYGIVRTDMRYQYMELTRKAKEFKDAIEWMRNEVYSNGH